ncbi:SgcJ/EcaC family oxidoreductase [Nonomuraea sp. ZG12]|uniref:SgcJ/EcaC family oxidoreductase n=1 Tax=Nonomuraea sp. ZG12 TaxID=3452207 RepID=UPI003F8BDDAF
MEQSVEAMSTIPTNMYEAWNRGDVAGFFADFAEDALFAELEGTIYRSRAEAITAHEALLGTVMKGSRLVRGEVPFARIISPGVGVVHSRVGILMPGEEEPPPTRFSMQLFVVVWRDDRWVVVALENARLLSLETMAALESLESLA